MAYTKINWQNINFDRNTNYKLIETDDTGVVSGSTQYFNVTDNFGTDLGGNTPIDQINLGKMDDAIFDLDAEITSLAVDVDSLEALSGIFNDGDLAAGILTITHAYGNKVWPYVITDDIGDAVIPTNVTYSNNQILIDLTGYSPISGSWAYAFNGGGISSTDAIAVKLQNQTATAGNTDFTGTLTNNGNPITGSGEYSTITAWPASSIALTASDTLQDVELVNTTTCGTKLTFNSTDGRIVIGAGVTKVMIGASLTYVLSSSARSRNLYIQTSTGISKKFTFSYATTDWNGKYWPVIATPIVIGVTEGTELKLVAYGNIGDTISNSTATNLTVQVLE